MHRFDLAEYSLDDQTCEFVLSCDLPEEFGSASSYLQRVKLSADQRAEQHKFLNQGFALGNVWEFDSLKVNDSKSDE